MRTLLQRLRSFTFNLGLVEQAQIVASTAVIVMLVTIIAANILLKKELSYLDFIGIITIGIIGYASVFFSLKYGRQIEEQRKELEALNTVSQVVSQSINLNYIFSNILQSVTQVLRTEYGWLYVIQGERLILKNVYGAGSGFFSDAVLRNRAFIDWVKTLRTEQEASGTDAVMFHDGIATLRILSWVSVPLKVADRTEGILLLASGLKGFFTPRKVNLIAAFSNQIGVALNNAHLFDKLRESEERYADLFENSPDMYHLVNRDGVIVGCNQTESQILGYGKSEIVGRPMSHLYPPAAREKVNSVIRESFQFRREIRGSEEQMMKKDGAMLDVSVNTSLVYDDNGSPVLMRCLVRDITEKKRFELQILQSQRIDSIGNIAGGIAHDFNNILTSIMGAASIMRRRITPRNRLYPFVDIIETASTRGKSLTNQLLTFARRTPVEFHPINLHDLLEETLRIFEPSVKPLVTVTRRYADAPPIVNGDDGQVQQAILNLFINARDAMPSGGELTIATSVTDTTVTITVADNGVGMPPAVQEQVFVPFFTTKEQGKGTGLGLSVVYGVMQSHNGSVTFTSAVGAGSSFVLTFPLYANYPKEMMAAAPRRLTKGTESVLIVDDEEFVRMTLRTMLADLGYTVTVATTGAEALTAVRKRKRTFDLIILDMNMPEMGGKKVFEAVRAMKVPSAVIVSSGYSDDILGADFASRVDGFLQKPYKIEELAKKLRDVLDGRR
ncbi:MAG: PAS domain S-box protein [Bacteroidetes bacterium]|nr:MAG: PAS domain S-box protein [Bacteroidota bacterium]